MTDKIPIYELKLSETEALRQLPSELAERIRNASGAQYLDALAQAALHPRSTEWFFAAYEPLFVDIASRWLDLDFETNYFRVISSFSRILPFAPYLRSFAASHVVAQVGQMASAQELQVLNLDDHTLQNLLLSVYRLLSFDLEAFSGVLSSIQLQSLFQHSDNCVRYLAIRCFCSYMHVADAATQKMLEIYIGSEPVHGLWEGIDIDYRVLGLWEERRWQYLESRLREKRITSSDAGLELIERFKMNLTPRSANIGGVLVPRERWERPVTGSSLVKTPTVQSNLRDIATSLLDKKSLLLIGLPNSGKTSLVNDIARTMGQGSSMVTLHLNEQTDAKSLLGMYATSSMTGALSWKPGVLTKAAKEGRWLLIEDLDRAPSEVIGLMLPIIERGELIIPSRKERIKCADGFRIIATMKSSLNNKGEDVAPSHSLLGIRLWNKIHIRSLPLNEVCEVIARKFPLLSSRVGTLMDIYDRLCSAFHSNLAVRSSQGRTPGLRDLIKLCNRLHTRLGRLGAKTGNEETPESFQDEMFLDAVDIFIRFLPDRDLGHRLSGYIAECLQMSPQRARFCLQERTPPYADRDTNFSVGRENCIKMKVTKASKSKFMKASSRFAPTRAALNTMEQIAGAIQLSEPVLLVGETGIGKTAVIQQLANLMCQKLTVVNLSQQSESTDLLGGFRPVNIRSMAVPLLDEFNELFEQTFSAKKNQKFLASVTKSLTAGNWPRLVNLWHEAVRMAETVFRAPKDSGQSKQSNEEQPSKKRKLDSPKYIALKEKWDLFNIQLTDFEAQATRGDSKFAFAFVQGKIVRALRNGEWVLLDEINLATPDILENIASLLHHGDEGLPSVLLSEAGDVERVYGHSNFRIFGAMNPATDAGKRDLAPGLRSRFTEIYVHSPDVDLDDLLGLIQTYLGDLTQGDLRLASDIATLYLDTKKLGAENRLTDGAGQKPHFSIRTLVRTLVYIVDHVHIYGIRRAAYEGFCMSFLTLLSQESEKLVLPLIEKYIFGSAKHARSLLGQVPRPPNDGSEYVQFKHYWMRKGPFTAEKQPHYIITPFIEKNLKNLLRASSTRRFPILLQGPTSSGKTSMVEYLAKVSGNKFVRINNHEHTDLQEYLGSYVSTDDGSLRYQEGILVEALRNGYWIVLDELNLAPSDVLEALNRLLDDNRELFLPETQEVIHPHPNFMLFATQNPAGLYGGRKVLSRAFRNRFLELHFDDIPEDELEFILKERTQIAPSFCARIVTVYKKLSVLRQSTRLFEQKNSFATLRDLFRWALRQADDRETLAINGFMLLAERVRNSQERAAVKKVIEEVMKVKIDEDAIYSSSELERLSAGRQTLSKGVVWTKAMRRVFVLVSQALQNNEPVLLVGETGCGKTQICQAVSEIHGKDLLTVNAHVNLETGDLIGAQRPLRNRSAIEQQLLDDLQMAMSMDTNSGSNHPSKNLEELKVRFSQLTSEQLKDINPEVLKRIKTNITRSQALFEWSDGSLVTAMKTGQYFLLDEVSLADDSVLERLNSVLEPHRSLLLAEKGPVDSLVVAQNGYQFLSTMNPGGDYGKRELSAALRNRMTEIWVPQLSEEEDILPILKEKLRFVDENSAKAMLEFAKWFKKEFQGSTSSSVSIRDLLAWVEFINKCSPSNPNFAIIQGAAMVYIDTLGANPSAMLSMSLDSLTENRRSCLEKLTELFKVDATEIYDEAATVSVQNDHLCIGAFQLPMSANSSPDPQFVMDAPTTIANSVRIARGLQSSKPILLEGSPGVGKTTLVESLARALGKPFTRINLSEQTDLTDLFGSDVPVEGGDVGQFAWRDAPFLQAMQRGNWVLLDEMNLASQSVLEGLNSCLDHRQQVYVAELDQTFKRHPDFVLFAAQNPHHQGGGRKGLPASFVNRFTVVYADSFSDADLKRICSKLFPRSPPGEIEKVVNFMSRLNTAIVRDRRIGNIGGPWELNLRDITRWLQLTDNTEVQIPSGQFLENIICQRFRSEEDRRAIFDLFKQAFGVSPPVKSYYHNMALDHFQVGLGVMKRDKIKRGIIDANIKVLPSDLEVLESLIFCVQRAWPSILVGPSGCGKTATLRKLAAIQGAELVELALSPDTDTMDLIGGFEQIDYRRQTQALAKDLAAFLHQQIVTALASGSNLDATSILLEMYDMCRQLDVTIDKLFAAIKVLQQHCLDQQFDKLARQCDNLVQLSKNSSKVGFEWTEGALTEAIQYGYWVVLDNANLCNASVLDRLNSLMEPNGYLVLNEQRTEDGSARVIKPHPNFRLFLTMDPRNGELSRAMRNRSVEISFLPQPETTEPNNVPSYTLEAALYRLRYVWNLDNQNSTAVDDQSLSVRLDHIQTTEMTMFYSSLQHLSSLVSIGTKPNAFLELLERYIAVVRENPQWRLLQNSTFEYGLSGLELVHPLINEPHLVWHPTYVDRMMLIAHLQRVKKDLHHLKQCLANAKENSQHMKPSQMTRLERSFASSNISSLMKDSTQPVSSFLIDCAQTLHEFIQTLDGNVEFSTSSLSSLRDMARFCWDIYRTTQAKELDEGEFQIYLQTGQKILAVASDQGPLMHNLSSSFSQIFARFQATWTLTTGLSMRRIWDTWRPVTCSGPEQLNLLLNIEAVITEFSKVALQTSMGLAQLGTMWKSLVDAQNAMLLQNADGKLLVEGLKQQVQSLTSATESYTSYQPPHFSNVFETICEYHDLPTIWSKAQVSGHSHLNETLPLLAGRSAHGTGTSSDQLSVPNILHKLALYNNCEGKTNAVSPWNKTFSTDLLQRLEHVSEVCLGRLEFLQYEQRALIEAVALSSNEIALAQEVVLSKAFARILLELLWLHQDFLENGVLEIVVNALSSIEETGGFEGSVPLLQPASNLPSNHFFREFIGGISDCIKALASIGNDSENDLYTLGFVSVQLAVVCLRLFVPDKPYDPSLGLVIERRRHAEQVLHLQSEDQALVEFETEFSGKTSNLRRLLIEEELKKLGSAPPASPVTRPTKSQLLDLHGEFLNLFNSVLSRNPEKYGASEFQQYGHLLTDNIRQICARFHTNFRAYDDITILVTRFLQLLDLGASLCSYGSSQQKSAHSPASLIIQMTPFLGDNGDVLKEEPIKRQVAIKAPLDVRLQQLSSLVLRHSIDSSAFVSASRLQELREILHSVHQLWKTQLAHEQKETAEKNRMYRYKGSFEDTEQTEESELRELFPTYEESIEEPSKKTRLDPQTIASKLTQLHAAIFEHGDVQTMLRRFITKSTRLLGCLGSERIPSSDPKSQLPGILLVLTDDMKSYDQVSSRHYNFYSDANIIEAKRLVSLVLSIRARFLQLQATWPEHAAIHDVLHCCQEILQFKHKEPIAKFITKLEKLHSFVHEWQLVASKEFSAASLYDNITALIISWRRLELSTWAKLLDIEYEKCEQAVSAWWFVAYEVMIAVPLQMAEDGEDLKSYTKETLATLEGFFKSTTMGQYSSRLRLVERFRSLLALFVQQHPVLNCFISALDNFLQHYRVFEPVISKSLEEGRKSLEKSVKEQIQLASWKDTNITALRESARRSHYKLFKYVRKYRELLAGTTDLLLQQGMPEPQEQAQTFVSVRRDFDVFPTALVSDALSICQTQDSIWTKRAPRFKDPVTTASSMLRVYTNSIPELDVSSQLSNLVTDVIDSIKAFKTQTPETLTEENKDDVQHLKTQKRRFYSETLKQLHFMGIRRNVSTVFIEEQSTTAQVLATTPSLSCDDGPNGVIAKSADSYFQRLLDVLPRVRIASRDYNEDLNPAEVTRSAGSAEGFLLMIRKQRDVLSPAIGHMSRLKSTCDKMKVLWNHGPRRLEQENPSRSMAREDTFKRVLWLIPLLGVGAEIVDIHANYSSSNNVANFLQGWKDTFSRFRSNIEQVPEFPLGISSQISSELEQEILNSFRQFNEELVRLIDQRPDLAFALEQIISWVNFPIPRNGTNVDRDLTLENLNDNYLSVVDKVLVGLQGLKSSLTSLPPNIDEKDWLSQTDSALSKALRELHISDIHTSLNSVLDKLQYLQPSGPGLPLAAAIIAGLLPIINQYFNICEDLISRFLSIHREVCKMAYVLSKSFTQIASEGFCSPHEASADQSGSGKVESGTGLGDGEGAEDISKDVQDDEDLSELAQQQNPEQSSKDEIQQSEDAVNMDQEDLEGEFDDNKEKGDDDANDSDSDEDNAEEDEIDEEVGSVSDLDPNAVDEKLWDGGHDEQQKETENEEGKGVSESDEQTASKDKKKDQEQQEGDDQGSEGEEEEEAPENEAEAIGKEELDVTNPHAKEEQALDLPEEMQLDGEENEGADPDMDDDDGMDELSDFEPDVNEDKAEQNSEEMMEDETTPKPDDVDMEKNEDEAEEGEENGEADKAGGEEAVEEEPEQEDNMHSQLDDTTAADENVTESEAVSGGVGLENETKDEKGASGNAQQEGGSEEAGSEEFPNGTAEEGENRKKAEDSSGGTGDDVQDDPQAQAFKKLGDVLEQWHRRQKEIMNSSKDNESQTLPLDADMADADFEHLADDDDIADTQALGQASEEQAKALDDQKGVETEPSSANDEILPDVVDNDKDLKANEDSLDEAAMDLDAAGQDTTAGANTARNTTFVGEPSSGQNGEPPITEELDEVDNHLAAIHLSSALAPKTSPEEARQLWSHYEAITNDLSLSLTEQLRLILAPTLATKLRGDFRTGKRLNIKKIIPYIASQYKRDKIWMRRSIPSKRNYQIMLAVDDSKSMLESGSGQLAFETLALVARSLNMLEVGDLCIVGFGDEEHVRVAHDFGKPFSSEAGTQVFQQFSYQQTGTNVRKLVADSIALFREARMKRSGGGSSNSADLWQLELVISDGICEDHETIRRLVRQAQEERIMIVFIILDAAKGSSILDLTQASFEPDDSATGTGEMKLKMKRYLEGFPFSYYLVVRDVRELPAVLAMALKQWFAEVVDTSS